MADRRWSGAPRWEAPALVLVASVGLALRFVDLELGWFGVDQARDIATALDIASGRSFPDVGPTMRRVTRLGALYHYFWAIPYVLWRDPIAGYWFAAVLSAAALVLTWRIARRLWGPVAGVVAAAVAAVHPVWIIDGRVCWAPAALPFVAALVVWIALGDARREGAPNAAIRASAGAAVPAGGVVLGARRVALIGALLGLAVQLHLTMVGWVLGAGLLALLDRLPRRVLAAGIVAGALVGAPALRAMLFADGGTETGLTALPSRAPLAPVAPRLAAVAALPWRIPTAFSHWDVTDALATGMLVLAGGVLAAATACGLVRLAIASARGVRAARVVLIPGAVTAGLVLGLPGEAWYYYLDSLLPLWALAAAACVAPTEPSAVRSGIRRMAAVCVVGACVVMAAFMGDWLRRVSAAGYIPLDPVALTLDGRPARDAPSPGRLTTVAVKRGAGALAATLGTDYETVWRRVHGPALADAAGDNGFWFRWSIAQRDARGTPPTDDGRHLAFWYRDDPFAVRVAVAPAQPAVDRVVVGPLLAMRYPTAIDYASCRSDGLPVVVPIRVTPHPLRYGDGTPQRPPTLPAGIRCALDGSGAGDRLLVGALGGEGMVTIAIGDGQVTLASAGDPLANEVRLCVVPTAREVRLAIERPHDTPAEIDLYDVPLVGGCGG